MLSDLQVGLAYEIRQLEVIPSRINETGRQLSSSIVAHIENTSAALPYPYPARIYLPRRFLKALTTQEIEDYNEEPHYHKISVIYQGFIKGRHEILFI